MTAIRFDADQNAVAEEDPELTEEWGSYEDSVWYLTDGMSNGRWLFVGHASPGDGVPLGIGRGLHEVPQRRCGTEPSRCLAGGRRGGRGTRARSSWT